MRNLKTYLFALSLMAVNVLFAQNNEVKTAVQDAKTSVFEMAKAQAEVNARALNNAVDLTDEQKKQIKDLTKAKLGTLRTEEKAKPNALKGKAKAREMQAELNKEIMAVLTPAQAAQVKEKGVFRGEKRGHEGHDHDGKGHAKGHDAKGHDGTHGNHAGHDHDADDHAAHEGHDHDGHGHGKMTEDERMQKRAERAKHIAMDQSKELDAVVKLTDAQKDEVVRLNKGLFDQGRQFRRANPEATGDEKRIFAKGLMKQRLEGYREILTPAQIDLFLAHKREMDAAE